MPAALSIADAADCLHQGGVIAYPTEAVWGLGCDPFDQAAVMRLLEIKQRPVDKGLILIAGALAQFGDLLDWAALSESQRAAVLGSWPGPHTWIVPVTARVPDWIRGAHDGVAVRVSAHPVVAQLCAAFGGPLVSTSANPAGAAPAQAASELEPGLLAQLDGVVAGATSGLARPTAIRDARTGAVLRP